MKRGKKEIFTYIAKTSPKAKEYVCYAYEVPKGQVNNNYNNNIINTPLLIKHMRGAILGMFGSASGNAICI